MLFETYRFDDLENDRSVEITGWTYVWASLGGPVYVVSKGFVGAAAIMLAISAALATAAAAVLIFVAGFLDRTELSAVAAVVIPAIALVCQGVVAIQLVRRAFISRGWREGY